jgi:hypothetical protein
MKRRGSWAGAHEFQVKPDPAKEEFYWVRIFRNEDALRKYWRYCKRDGQFLGRRGKELKIGDVVAMCRAWQIEQHLPDGTWGTSPECGVVEFPFTRLGLSTVAHEMTHAAHYWCHRNGVKLDEDGYDHVDGHEKLAYAVGHLVAQFYVQYWKLFPKKRWRDAA